MAEIIRISTERSRAFELMDALREDFKEFCEAHGHGDLLRKNEVLSDLAAAFAYVNLHAATSTDGKLR